MQTAVNIALFLAVLIGVGAAFFVYARSPVFWGRALVMGIKAGLPFILGAVKPKDWSQEQLDRIAMGLDPHNISKLEHEHWTQRQAMKNRK